VAISLHLVITWTVIVNIRHIDEIKVCGYTLG